MKRFKHILPQLSRVNFFSCRVARPSRNSVYLGGFSLKNRAPLPLFAFKSRTQKRQERTGHIANLQLFLYFTSFENFTAIPAVSTNYHSHAHTMHIPGVEWRGYNVFTYHLNHVLRLWNVIAPRLIFILLPPLPQPSNRRIVNRLFVVNQQVHDLWVHTFV